MSGTVDVGFVGGLSIDGGWNNVTAIKKRWWRNALCAREVIR